jgi:hypothetical protein
MDMPGCCPLGSLYKHGIIPVYRLTVEMSLCIGCSVQTYASSINVQPQLLVAHIFFLEQKKNRKILLENLDVL